MKETRIMKFVNFDGHINESKSPLQEFIDEAQKRWVGDVMGFYESELARIGAEMITIMRGTDEETGSRAQKRNINDIWDLGFQKITFTLGGVACIIRPTKFGKTFYLYMADRLQQSSHTKDNVIAELNNFDGISDKISQVQ